MELLGLEDVLWKAAIRLRGSMDTNEYQHIVLGLIFLKYVGDAFDERRAVVSNELTAGGIAGKAAEKLLESRDEYTAEGVLWVPPEARWRYVKAHAKQSEIGKIVDNAMELIERDNPTLRGALPKTYARPSIDIRRLGELIDLISGIGLGAGEQQDKDILSQVYESFLRRFASSQAGGAGQFYSPRSVVKLLVGMIEPYKGRVYDGCCGSGGMFVEVKRFVEVHAGDRNDVALYGQELSETAWRLAKMNLAICGIEADLGPRWGDTFHDDFHVNLKADYIFASPPFNVADWGGERLRDDSRWVYGVPPLGNANYAWLQHFARKLSSQGVACIVLANGSLSSQRSGEAEIRRKLVEDDLVECIVALPGRLFYGTQISVSLWFLNRDKSSGGARAWRDRCSEVLFIDARKLGTMVDRTRCELTEADIAHITGTYHSWRGERGAGEYTNIPGFCTSARVQQISENRHVLVPGRYIAANEAAEDDESIANKSAKQYFRLGDTAAIYSGSVHSRDIEKNPAGADLDTNRRVLHPSFLTTPPISVERLPINTSERKPGFVLQSGDIVGRDFAADRRWSVIPEEYIGIQAAQGLLVIRVHTELVPREYIAAYLLSPQAEESFVLTGTVMQRLTRSSLGDVRIPRCGGSPDAIRASVARLEEGRIAAGKMLDDLDRARSDIFRSPNLQGINSRLQAAAGLSSLIARTLRRQSEPYRSFQETYPYAVARAVRQLHQGSDLTDRHEAVLRCSESLILSMGIFAMALGVQYSFVSPEVNIWAKSLAHGGVSLGHWLGIVRAVAKQARAHGISAGGLAELASNRIAGNDLITELEELVKRRNKIRHGGGPRTKAEVEKSLREIENMLGKALALSTFLSRTEWIFSERLKWDEHAGSFVIRALSIMGDHPDFEPVSFATDAPLPDGRLFVQIDGSGPMSLSPFCYLMDCPNCLAPELFYPDRIRLNSVTFKSLDRGHELESEGAGKEVLAWLQMHGINP